MPRKMNKEERQRRIKFGRGLRPRPIKPLLHMDVSLYNLNVIVIVPGGIPSEMFAVEISYRFVPRIYASTQSLRNPAWAFCRFRGRVRLTICHQSKEE